MDKLTQIKNAVEKIKLPREVKPYEVVISEDYSGMPAVYVRFKVQDKPTPGPAKIRALSLLKRAVAQEISKEQQDYYPYVQFV